MQEVFHTKRQRKKSFDELYGLYRLYGLYECYKLTFMKGIIFAFYYLISLAYDWKINTTGNRTTD